MGLGFSHILNIITFTSFCKEANKAMCFYRPLCFVYSKQMKRIEFLG